MIDNELAVLKVDLPRTAEIDRRLLDGSTVRRCVGDTQQTVDIELVGIDVVGGGPITELSRRSAPGSMRISPSRLRRASILIVAPDRITISVRHVEFDCTVSVPASHVSLPNPTSLSITPPFRRMFFVFESSPSILSDPLISRPVPSTLAIVMPLLGSSFTWLPSITIRPFPSKVVIPSLYGSEVEPLRKRSVPLLSTLASESVIS